MFVWIFFAFILILFYFIHKDKLVKRRELDDFILSIAFENCGTAIANCVYNKFHTAYHVFFEVKIAEEYLVFYTKSSLSRYGPFVVVGNNSKSICKENTLYFQHMLYALESYANNLNQVSITIYELNNTNKKCKLNFNNKLNEKIINWVESQTTTKVVM